MVENKRSSSLLFSLPVEIRTVIWELALQIRCVHILKNGRAWCGTSAYVVGHTVKECHAHSAVHDTRCSQCPDNVAFGVSRTCWQFYHETSALRYQQTLLCFASASLCTASLALKCSTVQVTGFSALRLCHVQIELGPAKYGDAAHSAANTSILRLLARDAQDLCTLSLNFTYCHRAATDTMLLGRKVLEQILRFQSLTALHLRLYEFRPGPLGMASLSQGERLQVQRRWKLLEAGLRLLTTSLKHGEVKHSSLPQSDAEIRAEIAKMSRRNYSCFREAMTRLVALNTELVE